MSPTVFREGPFRFHFFSREDARIHVHVISAEGEAKFWLEPEVELARSHGLSDRDLGRPESLRDACFHSERHDMAQSERPTAETILALEEELLRPETRASPERLHELLSSEFVEIGSSGTVYDRRSVVAALVDEEPAAVALSDFRVRPLADDVVLAIYRTTRDFSGAPRSAWRSSVWRCEDGQWRMFFHQGTLCPPA